MPISASDIVDKALTIIDEQLLELTEVAATEMSTREMALDILPEVCRDLIKELPYELKADLSKDATLNDVLDLNQIGEKKKVRALLPTDFWELVSTKLEVWARPVTHYISINDKEYNIQNNPFTRSGIQNPTVAICSYDAGMFLEYFSTNDENFTGIDHFKYVSFDNVPDDEVDGVRWPDELMDEVSKALASQLLVIKGNIEAGLLRGEETQRAIEQHD